MKADLHIHTCYSMDCATSPEQIVARCLKTGINCIAITDHGTTAGALRLKEIAPFPVIIGEEILTPFGEIMGLFLSKEITSKISPEEAVSQIKSQNGLVCIPHPFDRLRPSALKNHILEELLPQVDIIEAFNSRSLSPNSNSRAWQLAQKYGLAASAGSDAHTVSEIGNAYVEMPEFNNKDEFLQSLTQGKIFGHRTNPLVHVASTWSRLRKSNILGGKVTC